MARRVFCCHQRPAGAAVVLAATVFLPVWAQGTSPGVGSTAQADTPVGSAPLSSAMLGLSSSGGSISAIWIPNPMYKRLPQRGHEEVFRSYTQGLPVTKSTLLSRMPSSAAS